MIEEKSAVLMHSCHLEAEDWGGIMWGNPPHVLGRIPRAVAHAYATHATMLFIGTGVSNREGKVEAEANYDYAYTHAKELGSFINVDTDTLQLFLKDRSVLDTVTQNTEEEIKACFEACLERSIANVTLVSSPTHLPRCLATALALIDTEKRYTHFRRNLTTLASDVSYAGTTAADVVVLEPMHRGDLPPYETAKLARRVTHLIRSEQFQSFLDEWEALIEKYEKTTEKR